MNVPYQLKKVRIFLAYYRFVPILEKMACSMMADVKTEGVAGEEAAHEKRKLHLLRPQQKMEVVGHKTPSKTGGLGLEKEF